MAACNSKVLWYSSERAATPFADVRKGFQWLQACITGLRELLCVLRALMQPGGPPFKAMLVASDSGSGPVSEAAGG